MIKKLLLIFSLLGLAAAGAYAWRQMPKQDPYAGILKEKAMRSEFVLSIEEVGVIRAQKMVQIYTPFGGKITKILDDGSTVTKGQTVVWLDTEDVEKRLDEQITNLKSTKNELERQIEQLLKGLRSNSLRVESSAAELEFSRLKLFEVNRKLETIDLLVEQSIVAKADAQAQELKVQSEKYNALNSDLTFQKDIKDKEDDEMAQESELGRIKLRSLKAKKNIEDAQKKISQAEIKAPTDGLLILTERWDWQRSRNVKPQAGDQVWDNQSLGEIPDLSSMSIVSQVSEEDISKVSVGQEAKITLDAIKDIDFRAKVSQLGMAAIARINSPAAASLMQTTEDTGQKVFELNLVLERADPRLRPGMTANVSIILETIPNALTLPISCVFRREGRPVVYLATPKGYRMQPVTLGRSNRDRVEILDGLNEGDEVFKKDFGQSEG